MGGVCDSHAGRGRGWRYNAIDMPLNSSPVTTTVAALEVKRKASANQCWVDVGFYGGLIPGNADSIEALLESGPRYQGVPL